MSCAARTSACAGLTGNIIIIITNINIINMEHLAERLSEKKQMPYSVAMGLIRCRLCFALLRAAIMCIRGARSSKQNPIFNSPFELQVAEGHLVI